MVIEIQQNGPELEFWQENRLGWAGPKIN